MLSLHSSNEPGELSQWLCHDDSTIYIISVIIIIIIIAPDAVARPSLESISSSAVKVSWSAPRQPNGIITRYLVERRLILDDGASADPVTVTVVVVPPYRENYEYLDESVSLRPHTTYEYRVAAQTSAGLTHSPWTSIVTRSASTSL